jgi:hypothetical protein
VTVEALAVQGGQRVDVLRSRHAVHRCVVLWRQWRDFAAEPPVPPVAHERKLGAVLGGHEAAERAQLGHARALRGELGHRQPRDVVAGHAVQERPLGRLRVVRDARPGGVTAGAGPDREGGQRGDAGPNSERRARRPRRITRLRLVADQHGAQPREQRVRGGGGGVDGQRHPVGDLHGQPRLQPRQQQPVLRRRRAGRPGKRRLADHVVPAPPRRRQDVAAEEVRPDDVRDDVRREAREDVSQPRPDRDRVLPQWHHADLHVVDLRVAPDVARDEVDEQGRNAAADHAHDERGALVTGARSSAHRRDRPSACDPYRSATCSRGGPAFSR